MEVLRVVIITTTTKATMASIVSTKMTMTNTFMRGVKLIRRGVGPEGESAGGAGYHPNEDNAEHGQQDYHPKEKQPQRTSRNNNSVSPGDAYGFLQYVLFGLLTVLLAFLIYQLFYESIF